MSRMTSQVSSPLASEYDSLMEIRRGLVSIEARVSKQQEYMADNESNNKKEIDSCHSDI